MNIGFARPVEMIIGMGCHVSPKATQSCVYLPGEDKQRSCAIEARFASCDKRVRKAQTRERCVTTRFPTTSTSESLVFTFFAPKKTFFMLSSIPCAERSLSHTLGASAKGVSRTSRKERQQVQPSYPQSLPTRFTSTLTLRFPVKAFFANSTLAPPPITPFTLVITAYASVLSLKLTPPSAPVRANPLSPLPLFLSQEVRRLPPSLQ